MSTTSPDHSVTPLDISTKAVSQGSRLMPKARKIDTILLIDSDEDFVRQFRRAVLGKGCRVVAFPSIHKALRFMYRHNGVDLIVIDWKAAQAVDGNAATYIRYTRVTAPILALGAGVSQKSEEQALAAGAVDFVRKSRGWKVIVSRIKLALQLHDDSRLDRVSGAIRRIDRHGALELNLEVKKAYWRRRAMSLTTNEFSFLLYLVRHPDADVSYAALTHEVFGKSARSGIQQDRVTLRGLVSSLRRKFRKIDPRFDRIGTYPRVGYSWRTEDD